MVHLCVLVWTSGPGWISTPSNKELLWNYVFRTFTHYCVRFVVSLIFNDHLTLYAVRRFGQSGE